MRLLLLAVASGVQSAIDAITYLSRSVYVDRVVLAINIYVLSCACELLLTLLATTCVC
jgi:hypothetical protein